MRNDFFFIWLVILYAFNLNSCSGSKDTLEPCQFVNPVASGHDPWVIKKEDTYYFIESRGRGIYLSETKELTRIKANQKQIWKLSGSGWNQHNLWAPELHYLEGKWYVYYAAGRSGPPYTSQRSGVLQAASDDPFGGYIDKGMLYTGDDIETGEDNKWAIDLTVLNLNDQLYAIWSGWEENRDTDKTPQHLYIAKMENPWTISSNRVKLSLPEEHWETGGQLDLQEGPQILTNDDDDIFIIYSTRESWMPAYRLGQLRLKNRNADPMDPDNWEKSGPVFTGTKEVHGVGHASFTKSPDGTENWIIYHTKADTEPGWERLIHMQIFTWNEYGSPEFGEPVSPGVFIPKPSGECMY